MAEYIIGAILGTVVASGIWLAILVLVKRKQSRYFAKIIYEAYCEPYKPHGDLG